MSRWVSPLGSLTSGFTAAAYGSIASAKSDNEAVGVLRHAKTSIFLLVAAVGLLLLVASVLVKLTLGDRYAASALVLRVLALGAVPSAAAGALTTVLQARGHHKVVSITYVAWAMSYLGTVGLLARSFGPWLPGVLYGASALVVTAVLVRQLAFRTERG